MTGNDTVLNPAGLLDAPLIAAIQNEVFPAERWSAASVAQLLQTPGSIGWIAAGSAYGEVMPVGCVLGRIAADEAELLTLGVLPEARRHGIGRRLLEALVAGARAGGARRIHLEVGEDNAPARGLYTALGFRNCGRRPGYYRHPDGRREDAVLLVLEMAEHDRDSGIG